MTLGRPKFGACPMLSGVDPGYVMSIVEDDLRNRLVRTIEILEPFSKSTGPFPDVEALKIAMLLAAHSLESAMLMVGKLPTTP
jgi:hypothetical protein